MTNLIIATAGDVDSSGITLIIPPATTASEKRYKCLATGEIIVANDMVLCAKIDGTYVVLGKVDTETGGDEGEDEGGSIPAGGTAGQLLAKASNADYDAEWVWINDTDVNPDEIGIVITGARPSMSVSVGQYVIVRNSTISGISDGLYTANNALSPNANVTAADLTVVSEGGLNALNDGLIALDGELGTLNDEFDALNASALTKEAIKALDVSIGSVASLTARTYNGSVSPALSQAPSAFWLGRVTMGSGGDGIIVHVESFSASRIVLRLYNPTNATINYIRAVVYYIE